MDGVGRARLSTDDQTVAGTAATWLRLPYVDTPPRPALRSCKRTASRSVTDYYCAHRQPTATGLEYASVGDKGDVNLMVCLLPSFMVFNSCLCATTIAGRAACDVSRPPACTLVLIINLRSRPRDTITCQARSCAIL